MFKLATSMFVSTAVVAKIADQSGISVVGAELLSGTLRISGDRI